MKVLYILPFKNSVFRKRMFITHYFAMLFSHFFIYKIAYEHINHLSAFYQFAQFIHNSIISFFFYPVIAVYNFKKYTCRISKSGINCFSVTTIFLVDFLFHGLERMHVITVRYFITRVITVALTFLLIKDDSDLLLIPLLEIIGNLAAIVWVWRDIRKSDIPVAFRSWKETWAMLKDSFVYFLSDIASTAFGALNTLIIGIVMTERDVSVWGIAMTFVSAVQMMYTPITNSIYPHMVREKSLGVIKKVLMIFLPIVIVGCVVVWFGAELLVLILAGKELLDAAPLLRWLIPLLFISFLAAIFGWPVLGAIGKSKETTITTITAAAAQVLGLVVLLALDQFNFFNLAMLRAGTDLLLTVHRMVYCWKYRGEFAK